MAASVFNRYELKFLLNQEQYEAVLRGISDQMIPDEHCRDGRCYSIYNVYYDTEDYSLVRTSLSKPYFKEKLRLRSYRVPGSLEEKVFLEMKRKTGGIVHKRRATMTLGEAKELLETGVGPVAQGYQNRQVIRELECFLGRHRVYPAACISYDRSAFYGKQDRNFRITFDRNILYRESDLLLESGGYGSSLLEAGQHLMEIKIAQAMPLWLAELLSGLGIHRTGFSKYGRAYQFSRGRERSGSFPVPARAGHSPVEIRTA